MHVEGTRVDGGTFDWGTYRGKIVLVQFWHTACRPAVLARVATNYELYHDRGLEVVVISLDSDREALDQYLQAEQPAWVTLHEQEAAGEHPVAVHYGISRAPASVLVDRQGKVVLPDAESQQIDQSLEQLIGPPYVPRGRLFPIDLQATVNQALPAGFKGLSRGKQTLGGVQFLIGDEVIRLGGLRVPNLPERVEGILVDGPAERLYLFHATMWGRTFDVCDGTTIGRYDVHYMDGTQATIPIICGEDVRDSWNWDESRSVTRGKVVWEGTNPAAPQGAPPLRLYLSAWENPHPDKKIVSIDFVSANTNATPFCVAITAEEAADTSTEEVP
jgi:hypothetical protein